MGGPLLCPEWLSWLRFVLCWASDGWTGTDLYDPDQWQCTHSNVAGSLQVTVEELSQPWLSAQCPLQVKWVPRYLKLSVHSMTSSLKETAGIVWPAAVLLKKRHMPRAWLLWFPTLSLVLGHGFPAVPRQWWLLFGYTWPFCKCGRRLREWAPSLGHFWLGSAVPICRHCRKVGKVGFVCLLLACLLNVPTTLQCFSGTDLLRQYYMLPHWDRSCRSNFLSLPVTVHWHRANQSQRWPYNARHLAG